MAVNKIEKLSNSGKGTQETGNGKPKPQPQPTSIFGSTTK